MKNQLLQKQSVKQKIVQSKCGQEQASHDQSILRKSVKKRNVLDSPLTPEQKKLVQDNIGLVAVHLRRYVANLSQPRRDREWEDLFQEGCIGLIRSAMLYRKDAGYAFAAFALPRIHNAVSRALERKFTTVIVPLKRSKRVTQSGDPSNGDDQAGSGNKADGQGSGSSQDGASVQQRALAQERALAQQRALAQERALALEQKRPREYSMLSNADVTIADHRTHSPFDSDRKPDQETIGDRLRSKYERAVQEAVVRISRRASTRGDRDELLSWITKERFLIPHEESRRALRQIARDTNSSYARVAQCDKQLAQIVKSVLEDDPEFCELHERKKNDPEGVHRPIDRELESQVRRVCSREYMRRYKEADEDRRAQLLQAVVRAADGDVEVMIDELFSELNSTDREKLFLESSPITRKLTSASSKRGS